MTCNHPETSVTAQEAAVKRQPEFAKIRSMANLYRHEATGIYYALLKRGGKQFRRSLKTTQRRLAERNLTKLRDKIDRLKIGDGASLDFQEVAQQWVEVTGHTLKPSSIKRLRSCIKAVAPYFRGISIRNVQRTHVEVWLKERSPQIAAQTHNHEVDAMRGVFNYAVKLGLMLDNPARDVGRRSVRNTELTIPSRSQFAALVAAIRASDGRSDSQAKAAPGADLVELLAYSGMRLTEATSCTWRDVDFDKNILTVRGPRDIGTKNSRIRSIPMTADLRALLLRIHQERQPQIDDEISLIKDAKTTIDKNTKKLGLPHLHHHDFRHFFATTCIEAGVDIPTVSRWLGHTDGGALAMKVYGHLRTEHSFQQIKLVHFAPQQPANVMPMPTVAADADQAADAAVTNN
jgi:integrase